eukprot:GHVT01064705.1.p1 GENE.GHVT01064705.1~~GHVT01064705.1.p1  ORF type:complete len:439 (+),score=27.79 GHVT01064705.1:414-1730(+)
MHRTATPYLSSTFGAGAIYGLTIRSLHRCPQLSLVSTSLGRQSNAMFPGKHFRQSPCPRCPGQLVMTKQSWACHYFSSNLRTLNTPFVIIQNSQPSNPRLSHAKRQELAAEGSRGILVSHGATRHLVLSSSVDNPVPPPARTRFQWLLLVTRGTLLFAWLCMFPASVLDVVQTTGASMEPTLRRSGEVVLVLRPPPSRIIANSENGHSERQLHFQTSSVSLLSSTIPPHSGTVDDEIPITVGDFSTVSSTLSSSPPFGSSCFSYPPASSSSLSWPQSPWPLLLSSPRNVGSPYRLDVSSFQNVSDASRSSLGSPSQATSRQPCDGATALQQSTAFGVRNTFFYWLRRINAFWGTLQRGDVVVLHSPQNDWTVCKRIVALAGDAIGVDSQSPTIPFKMVVPAEHIWIQGDNPGMNPNYSRIFIRFSGANLDCDTILPPI